MELASSGWLISLDELERAPTPEGFEDVEQHFSGQSTRARYQQIILQARGSIGGTTVSAQIAGASSFRYRQKAGRNAVTRIAELAVVPQVFCFS